MPSAAKQSLMVTISTTALGLRSHGKHTVWDCPPCPSAVVPDAMGFTWLGAPAILWGGAMCGRSASERVLTLLLASAALL